MPVSWRQMMDAMAQNTHSAICSRMTKTIWKLRKWSYEPAACRESNAPHYQDTGSMLYAHSMLEKQITLQTRSQHPVSDSGWQH